MEEDNGKKQETPQFDDILVIRKKKSEEPPPPPPQDDSILEGSSEEETSRYDSVEINHKIKEVKRPKTNKKRLFLFGGMAAVVSAMLLGTAILYFTFSIEEPNLAPVKVRKKKDSTPSIVKAYRNVKNKLDDLKKASAERGMKELAEIDETPADKAAKKAKAEAEAAATPGEDKGKEEAAMSAEDKEKAEEARKEEEEKAKNPYSAYDLLPADKFAKEFLRLFTGSQREEALNCLAGSFKARPADLAFHDEVRTYIQAALPDDVLKIYNDIDLKQGDRPAILFVLGNIYYSEHVWADAARAYSKILSKSGDVPGLEEKNAFAKARSGNDREAYDEYEKFLVSKAVPENERILKLLKLSMLFYSPSKTEELLKRAPDFPDDSDSFRYYRLCRDAISGTLKLSSFSDWDPYSFHDLKVIALLAEGREKDVLMMRVPPSDFPDLWRVFIQWRNGAESWKELAARLHEKSSLKGGSQLKKFATSLWLGEKSPEALLKEIFLIEPDDYPLASFFLSEYYRKGGDSALSMEYARRAFAERGNIYKSMMEHYTQVK